MVAVLHCSARLTQVKIDQEKKLMPLTICSFRQYKKAVQGSLLSDFRDERRQVLDIIEDVRFNGDAALKKYTQKFDRVQLQDVRVSDQETAAALKAVDPALIEIIREARANIERFHRNQVEESWWERHPGRLTGQRLMPLQSVGAYIPGGTAAYPSSVLMTVVPAMVAGVTEILICTPPGRDGAVNPLTLAAAHIAGATAVFKAGGAQAVAAMAYGTETVPAVQKIVGPGNLYVTLAKKEVFGDVGIDMLAGPSEIVIVAGEEAQPAYIAADLLSQAEHDPLSRSILITYSEKTAQVVRDHLEDQILSLPRKETAAESLKNQGAIILIPDLDAAWPIVNELAPEHLELHIDDAWDYLDRISSAGSIFIGEFTPEPLGDYWAGSNHVIPTGRAARYASPLGVNDFIKRSNVISYTAGALQESAGQIAALARAEGLEAHARAVLIRRQNDESPIEG
jgi:histidinol dehydrogenase